MRSEARNFGQGRTGMTGGRSHVLGLIWAPNAALVALACAAVGNPAFAQQPRGTPQVPSPPALTAPLPNSQVPSGVSPQTAQCANAYHQALEPLRRDRAPALADLVRKARAADADLPGRWLYSAKLFQKAKPLKPAKPERICVETRDVRGQERCVRFDFKPLPPQPPEIATKAQPSAEDLRYLKLLNDTVEGRGAVPDVSANGRQTFLVQRLAQDLRLYVSQPPTLVLCAGAAELLEFYAGQILPIKRRHEELKAASTKLVELAAARTREISVFENRLYEAALASSKSVETARAKAEQTHATALAAQVALAAQAPAGSAPPTPLAAPVLPAMPVLQPKPAAPATLADYAVISLPAQIGEALRPLLPAALVAELTGERDTIVMLTKAQKAILDPEIKPATPPAVEVRDAAISALRLHEARFYAERYASRYGEIDTLLSATLSATAGANAKSCTCQD